MAQRGDEGPDAEGVVANAGSRMAKAVDILRRDVGSLRSGRATPALVEGIMVDYYNTPTPLNQLATINAPEAQLILIQPWDKQTLATIEKSLRVSELGFNPSNDGAVIKVPVPSLTQERRQEIVRLLKRKVEDAKVAIRNVRRDAVERLRGMERDKALPQDENRRAQDRLQKATESHVSQLDQISSAKEAEVMQV